MIVWSLFDSGNGSYYKVFSKEPNIENYSIGLDRLNKNKHFINTDLSSMECLEVLNTLPKPDLIIASPPCESWSVASAMKGGNACWKWNAEVLNIRTKKEYKDTRYNHIKSTRNRIMGELTTLTLIELIQYFKPKYYIIENPQTSRIWNYIEHVIGFHIPYNNLTYYNNYDYPVKKPTYFKSNIDLDLSTNKIKPLQQLDSINCYNERSNIPEKLVQKIIREVKDYENK